MDDEEFEKLSARATTGIRIQRYTRRFLDYLNAADLSISLAGYNTCMNLLATRVPALLFPYTRQREQPMRVDKIKDFLPVKILNLNSVGVDRLRDCIIQMLSHKKEVQEPLSLDMNGAANSAGFLGRWEKGN